MLADALGRPLRFVITPVRRMTSPQPPVLLDGQEGRAVIADKANDSNSLRGRIAGMGALAVIPSSRSRKVPIHHDTALYRHRNRIERCFNRFKHFRRFATRYDRRTIHFTGFVLLPATMIWLA